MDKLKKFLWIQKEGILVGSAWGLISVWAAAGLAAQKVSLSLLDKVMIFPTWFSGLFFQGMEPSSGLLIIPIIIGALVGLIVDFFYKEDE